MEEDSDSQSPTDAESSGELSLPERLSLKGEDAVMGRLVDILSTWYNDKRQRRKHRYKTVPAARYRDGPTLLID